MPVSQKQIRELRKHVDTIDFDKADKYERELHHDVMAHIHAYGDDCPGARSIIHLGATSCYVTDNTDVLQMREGLNLLLKKLKIVLRQLAQFAKKYAGMACLGYTHFQPAQLTTVGKRACLWLQDFALDFSEIHYRQDTLKFLGVKGAVGTQASFLALLDDDGKKVKRLDALVAKKMGFREIFTIAGQTYTRKQDCHVVYALANLASSAHKFATDLRLLAGLKEVEEPFEEKQVGSSAMPYKRNPMLCERICALSRFLLSLAQNPAYTHAVQWLERSLDDSANRRLVLAEGFLAADAILELLIKVTGGIVVNKEIIRNRVMEELPFIAAENILMAAVKKGGDRQQLHERLRVHSREAAENIKVHGRKNDLLDRVGQDPAFSLSRKELDQILNVDRFVGRAPKQVAEFLDTLK